jgi:hypothetical protein
LYSSGSRSAKELETTGLEVTVDCTAGAAVTTGADTVLFTPEE